MHYIGLMAGLGSSPLWEINPWSKWARKLKKRFNKFYEGRNDVKIYAFSSDFSFEKPFFRAVRDDYEKGNLGTLTGAGHSIGSAEWLLQAEALYSQIDIPYLGLIDMTRGDEAIFGAKAYGNIKFLDEFHGKLETIDFHPSFEKNGSIHKYHEINKGHTATANDKKVQNRIFKQITQLIPSEPLIG